jgi:5-(aminomethyl)-3-furanmethanol phosphate kinase
VRPGVRRGAPGAPRMRVSSITVLKIGGSLARSDAAARMMRALAARRVSKLLIVPGGGEFADSVRAAQSRHGLSERAAHHMALLAMHIMAVALADCAPGFVPAESALQFDAAWRDGETPVWLPAPMVLAAPDIAASWDITSDSLAAWVAGKMDAERLVLVKSCTPPAHSDSAQALVDAGIVDACFARFVEGRRFAWRVVTGVEAALHALQ